MTEDYDPNNLVDRAKDIVKSSTKPNISFALSTRL